MNPLFKINSNEPVLMWARPKSHTMVKKNNSFQQGDTEEPVDQTGQYHGDETENYNDAVLLS